MDSLWQHFDLSATSAVAVVATTTVMYLLLVLLLRTWGPRLLANTSGSTTASTVVLGAIVGRASLGLEPDLEAGLLALGTVLALMWLLQMSPRGSRKQAVPLVVLGVIRADALHRHGLSEADLWSRLRQSGHASLDEVAVALLEPSGQISMIATSSPVDRSALADVRGYDELPAALFAAD